jgi:hypothetical protein
MSVTDADFIDSDPVQAAQPRAGEPALKIRLVDLFDRMPADSQMVSHMRHGHPFREFQDVPLEAPGVSTIWVGKPDLHLPDHSTSQTEHPLDGKLDNRRPQANGKRYEPAECRSLLHDLPTPARATLQGRGILAYTKDRLSLLETSMNMVDSPTRDPETVVQYCGGHAFLAFSDFF